MILVFKKGRIPWNKGKKPSTKTLKKMSKTWFKKGQAVRKGAKQSKKSKQQMSVSKKKLFASGYVHPMQGKKHSEKSKQKMSDTTKKMYVTNSTYQPRIGKRHNVETKKVIRKARLKQVFPQKDTKLERKLQKLLKDAGIEFEKHKPILGQPDAFIQPNICIFTDGDFWHANPKPWIKHGIKQKGFKSNDHLVGKKSAKDAWDYDKKITNTLKKDGYVVLRFWESELETDPEKCLQKIIKIIKESRR